MKQLIRVLMIVVLFVPLSTRAEIYYDASRETCYNDEEMKALRATLNDCDIKDLDLHTTEVALKKCQSKGGYCGFQWETFIAGTVSGIVLTAILTNIVKGGR